MISILTTFLITVFITFPGVVFRRIYYQHEFSKQFFSSEWNASLTFSIFFGAISSFLAFSFFNKFSFFKIYSDNIRIIKDCILSNQLETIVKIEYLFTIVYFSIVSVLISISLGYLLYKLVRVFHLDKVLTFLRFENHWHYYFTGEALKFNGFKTIKEHKHLPDSTIADVLVGVPNDKPKLYRGQLQQHTISRKTGELQSIYLIYAAKYKGKSLVEIPGKIFLIPYKNIININLEYYYESNVNRQPTLDLAKKLLWLFYTLNLVVLLIVPFNLYNSSFKKALVLYILIHITIFFLYQVFLTAYEYRCLKKETTLSNPDSAQEFEQETLVRALAYSLIFMIFLSVIFVCNSVLS